MVRPRFAKLPPTQQHAILRAALDEFAAHGFHDASLNRIIEAAGVSKGSMYYYFDGKEDLYSHVVQTELERLFTDLGPFPVPSGSEDADTFWSTLTDYYLRLMSALTDSPQLAGLVRGWIAAARNPLMRQAQQELEQAMLPWLRRALTTGQRVRAVRTDLPPTLLIAVVVGMGEVMDTWLMTQQPDQDELPKLIDALIDMIRGAVEPRR